MHEMNYVTFLFDVCMSVDEANILPALTDTLRMSNEDTLLELCFS